jgi:Fe-Mn family superoxide dismutase
LSYSKHITMNIFKLPELPYTYDALEPFIDAKTMEIHHSKHHQAYVDNLNKVLAGIEPAEELTLEELMKGISKLPLAVRNNGGGHYNHSFFWKQLIAPVPSTYNAEQLAELNKQQVAVHVPTSLPTPATKPLPKLLADIENSFGSLEIFKLKFAEAAAARFGSGWVWLIVSNDDKKLTITSTPNQDNPLMDLPEIIAGVPVIALDVWEHAYYLKYQNKRPDYVTAFWNLLNWEKAEQNYLAAK